MSATGSHRAEKSNAPWPRVIAHVDMDAFYAAVEQLDDPSLRGRPILVGSESRRGVVLTASYEARPYGVGSAMPMMEARRLCPQALVVPPRFARYQEISAAVMGVFARFSPTVEPLSLDEAFLDMTGSERLFGDPAAIGRKIKDAVREVTGGLTASVGLSGTKYVAKVASGFRKPDGLTIVPQHEARAWLAPLPVDMLWGAGKKTAARLRELGFETIGDVAACPADELAAKLGRVGERFAALARAEDPRAVESGRAAKSIGSERTLERDVSACEDIEAELRDEADTVARRLRRHGLVAHGVRVKLKRTDFRVLTRQCHLAAPSDVSAELFAAAQRLLRSFGDRGPFRLIGIAAFDLVERDDAHRAGLTATAEPQALTLDFDAGTATPPAPGGAPRRRELELALDRVAERFGATAVRRAAALQGPERVGEAPNLDFLGGDEAEGEGATGDRRVEPIDDA